MLMRGTMTKSRQQIEDEMNRLKARYSVALAAGWLEEARGNAAQIQIETTESNLAGALRLTAEILRSPAFREADFEGVRRLRIADLERLRNETWAMRDQVMRRHTDASFLRGDIRYVSTTDEAIEDARKVTLDEVREFHRRFWGVAAGSDDALAISGQFDAAEMRKLAAELFGNWRSELPYEPVVARYPKRDLINVKVEMPDKQDTDIQLLTLLQMNDSHADYAALTLANHIFRNSVKRRIREKEGLSYGVNSVFHAPAQGDRAVFSGFAQSAPQNTPRVEASFQDELARVQRDGFTLQEIADAIKGLLEIRKLERSDDKSLAGLLVSSEQDGRTIAWDAELDKKIAASTADQVTEAFRRHIDPKALSIVKVGDFKKVGVYQK
jgi:zinc protease